MKAILEFDMPEEQDEFNTHLKGWRFLSCLQEFDSHCRGIVKHGTEKELATTWEEVRDKLWDIIKDNDVDIWGV